MVTVAVKVAGCGLNGRLQLGWQPGQDADLVLGNLLELHSYVGDDLQLQRSVSKQDGLTWDLGHPCLVAFPFFLGLERP